MQELIANRKAMGTLAAWIRGGRLPHTVLIEGDEGTGRKTFAGLVAAAILCEGAKTELPCGECRHCIKVSKGIHPDISVLEGAGGARSFHIDTVRQMRADAAVRPNEAESRVFLLLDVQNMSVQAQNALLKIVEEPPRGVHFIMICKNREQMLETIRSRASILTMEAPGTDVCFEYLAKRLPEQDEDNIRAAAIKTGGNIGKAILMLEQQQEDSDLALAREGLYSLLRGDELSALEGMRSLERDREGFLRYLASMRAAATELLPGHSQPGGDIPAITPLRLMQIVDIIEEISTAVVGNGSVLLLTTDLCARIRAAVGG